MSMADVASAIVDPLDHLHLIRETMNMPRYRHATKIVGRRDAFQAGFFGLAAACRQRRAVDDRFNGYAVRCIGNAILRETCTARPIALPAAYYRKTRDGRPCERDDYEDVMRAIRTTVVVFGSGAGCYDIAWVEPEPDYGNATQLVDASLGALEPKHRDVVREHYGLDGCTPGSPGEVGRRLGLARTTVVSRLKRAVEILQANHAKSAG